MQIKVLDVQNVRKKVTKTGQLKIVNHQSVDGLNRRLTKEGILPNPCPETINVDRQQLPAPFMVDSTELTYIILGLTLLGMIWYVTNRGRANLAKAREDAAPAVAGDDVLDGAAKNPEQFDEPDDEALDEMGKLLGEDEDQ